MGHNLSALWACEQQTPKRRASLYASPACRNQPGCHPECTWACGPPMEMKMAVILSEGSPQLLLIH
ncbi:hypothetical protein SBA2_450101 [Acidobacteriia bacterium SbA2]|nr:hypothetical protein SBA2_450101 [Acidobacteriia bacterium SbA2]